MSARAWCLAAGVIGCLVWAVPAGAHEGLRAVMTFEPAQPLVDEPCLVTVRLETVAGAPAPEAPAAIAFSADMSGHAMRPVEATLTPAGRAGEFQGRVAFTMAGPWTVTLTSETSHEILTTTMPVDVAFEPPPADGPQPAAIVGTLAARETPSAVDPWTILLGALGLTALLEIVAIGRRFVVDGRDPARTTLR